MAKVKVAVWGTVGKVVTIDTTLDSRVAALERTIAALPSGGSTLHSSLQGLQVGDDHPQYTMWAAAERIKAPWSFDANTRWLDSREVQFGTDGDMVVLHNGTNGAITNNTGQLEISSNAGFDLISGSGAVNILGATTVAIESATADVSITAADEINLNPGTNVMINGVTLTEFIEDVAAFEVEDTDSVTWSYADTAGALEASVDESWSPTWTGLHTFANAGGVVLDTVSGSPGAAFSLDARSTVTLFPAAFFRPTTANRVMAFDIMPNGSPTESPGNGFAWIDVCDADAATTDPALHCARVGITSTAAVFASRSFFGATVLPLSICIETTEAIGVSANRNVTIQAPASGSTLTIVGNASSTIEGWTDGTVTAVMNTTGPAMNFGTTSNHRLGMFSNGAEAGRFDNSATADDTRFWLYDVTAGTLVRVTRGATDSGGAGFRVLRIPN